MNGSLSWSTTVWRGRTAAHSVVGICIVRLLVISNFVDFPGFSHGAVFVRARAAELRKLGHEVELVPIFPVPSRAVPMLPRTRDVDWPGGPPHSDYQAIAVPIPTRNYVSALAGYPRRACETISSYSLTGSPHPFDLVVGHGSYRVPAAGVAREFSRATGTPYVAVAHGSDIYETRRTCLPYQREIFGGAAATIFVSRKLQRDAEARGFSPANPHVFGNGFDDTLFTLQPERSPGPIRLLFVGSLTRVKGADRLPDIMRAVWGENPNAELTIVGSGPLEDSLHKSKHPKVHFIGSESHDELAQHMQASDVLVAPSRSEGFGCVVKEAQATGTPVVATDVGGLPESVGSGGRLVNSTYGWDAQAFVAGINDCLANVTRGDAAAAAAGYSWAQIAKKESDLFEDLTQAGNAHGT